MQAWRGDEMMNNLWLRVCEDLNFFSSRYVFFILLRSGTKIANEALKFEKIVLFELLIT